MTDGRKVEQSEPVLVSGTPALNPSAYHSPAGGTGKALKLLEAPLSSSPEKAVVRASARGDSVVHSPSAELLSVCECWAPCQTPSYKSKRGRQGLLCVVLDVNGRTETST